MITNLKPKRSAFDIAKWFIENNPFLKYDQFGNKENHLKLEKLLHYSNTIMYLLYGKPLFYEEVVAYREGFVIEDFYREYRDNSDAVYNTMLKNDFDKDERTVICLTNVLFGKLTGYELSRCVHMDDIWDGYDDAACDIGSHRILKSQDIFDYYGKQHIFKENIDYYLANLATEIEIMENLRVFKLYRSDNVFFYFDKNLSLSRDDKEVLRCISEENGSDAETQYYYLYKDEQGVLNIE